MITTLKKNIRIIVAILCISLPGTKIFNGAKKKLQRKLYNSTGLFLSCHSIKISFFKLSFRKVYFRSKNYGLVADNLKLFFSLSKILRGEWGKVITKMDAAKLVLSFCNSNNSSKQKNEESINKSFSRYECVNFGNTHPLISVICTQ